MATNRTVYTAEQLQCLEVNLENLEKAAKCLFNNQKQTICETNKLLLESDVNFAHQWLLWVQKSKDAWQMVWFILNTSTQSQSQPGSNTIAEVSPEVQYFGANTLQFKIQKHLHDLNAEEMVNLRDKLLSLITQQSGQTCPKFVRTRLLVCLASLIIRTVGDTFYSADDLWGEGGDAIGQLVSLFSNGQIVQSLDAHSRLNILVQLLTFVPEEYATSFLTKRHRNSVFKYCREKAIPCTLSLLTSLLKVDSTSVEQRCSALNMINAWCQFGISLPDNIELLQLLYNHLLRVHPSEVDTDFTCELFNTLGHLIGQPVSAKCTNTFFNFLLPMTLNIQSTNSSEGATVDGARTSLRQLIEEVLQNGEETTVNAVCGYLLSLADTYCNSIVMPPIAEIEQLNENCFRVLTLCEMVLKFTAKQGYYPVEETCSSLTFAFWYNLQEDIPVCISVISDSSPGSVDTNAKVILERHCSNLMTIMTQLIVVLSQKCEYPPKEILEKWTSDEIEQLRCFRIDCNDYIASLQTLFGVEILGQTLLQIYLSILAQLNSASSPEAVPWQKIEAPLYLLSGCNLLGEAPDCGVVASPVLSTLPQVMTMHPNIMESCCDFIGQLAIWMCEQHTVFYEEVSSIPTVLQNIVRMLCSSLDCEEDISLHAAMALKEIAAASVTELHSMAFEIFSKVKPILHKEVVPKLSLMENLVFAVGKSISALDNQQIIQITNELLKPHSERLLKFLQSSPGDVSNMHNSLTDSSGPEAALMQKMRVNATVSAAHIWLSLFTQLVVSIDVGGLEGLGGGGDVDDHDCGWVRPGNEPDPCIVLLEQVDPVIKLLMERFASKDTVVCDICGLYKRTYYNIKHRITKISPQICSYSLKFLSISSPGLNHPTSVLHMFTTLNVLPSHQVAQTVVQQAFQIIVTNYFNPQNSSHYSDPDFLAEVFCWIQDLCKDNGHVFEIFKQSITINEELLSAVFKLVLSGLKVQESMAFRNCLAALTDFAKNSVNHGVIFMQNCVIQSMGYIVDCVCEALAGITCNMNGFDAYASLLLHLNRGYPSVLEAALKTCVADSKFNTTHCSEADVGYFVCNVLKEKTSKSNMRETCSNFSTACVGTQSNLSKGFSD